MRPLALFLMLVLAMACSDSSTPSDPTTPDEEEEGDPPTPPGDTLPPPPPGVSVPDPSMSTAAVEWGVLYDVTQVTFELLDEDGLAVDTVLAEPRLEVRGANAGRPVTVNRIGTGTYQAIYVPTEPGFDTLSFTLAGFFLGHGWEWDLVRHFHVPAARGVPTLDGVLSPGEWPESAMAEVESPGADPVRVYALNDDDSAYVAVAVPAATLTWANGLRVRFDDANNAVLDHGDHAIRVSQGGVIDMHYDSLSADDRTEPASHGSGIADNDGTFTVFEFSLPLDNGDPLDLQTAPGSSFGMCMHYFFSAGSVQYPEGCMDPAGEQLEYGEIRLAN